MRVLVCGGRTYADRWAVFEELDLLNDVKPIALLIHGGAAGADALAGEWAKQRDVPVRVFLAAWDVYGKRAGPVRNQEMLTAGQPDLVLAFPGGRGTADMVSRARNANVPVVDVPPAPSQPEDA